MPNLSYIPNSPLRDLLRILTKGERARFAAEVGTTVNYLYALAGGHRESPRLGLAFAIEDISRRWHNTDQRVPVITARGLYEAGLAAGL